MSDFFGSLNSSNVRFTDARINGDGPLPTNLSGPEGISGDPDGRYNFNTDLLSNITPYAGPQAGRMGSDRNYQQIPHRKQFPVPPIWLPEPAHDAEAFFDMSHAIDMGDVVFIVSVHQKHLLLMGTPQPQKDAQDNTMPNYNLFCNICTVNYILAGICNYSWHYVTGTDAFRNQYGKHTWHHFMRCLGIDERLKQLRVLYAREEDSGFLTMLRIKLMLQQVIRDTFKPIGICSTSEKQGGQHEVGMKPVQAAASFFVTLTVDGQNRDLVNLWRGVNVQGGDQLLLQLEYIDLANTSRCQAYKLNHYYKGFVQRSVQMPPNMPGYFQLVPETQCTAFEVKHSQGALLPRWRSTLGVLPPWTTADIARNSPSQFVSAMSVYLCNPYWNGGLPRFCNIDNLNGHELQVLQEITEQMVECVMDNRHFGYWHIGQVYNKMAKFAATRVPTDDM